MKYGTLPLKQSEKNDIICLSRLYELSNDEFLYRKPTDTYQRRIVPAPEDRTSIISSYHSLMGHANPKAVHVSIAANYYWPRMLSDIRALLLHCNVCLQNNHTSSPTKALFNTIHAKNCFEKVQADTIGPLPLTFRNNRYIFLIVDVHSRWVEAHASPDKSCESFKKFFTDAIVHRFGTPKKFQSDNGGEFTGAIFAAYLEELNVEVMHSSPYYPQANGLVERTNQSILLRLAKFVQASGKDWDLLLQSAVFGFNITSHSSTKLSPYEIVYSRPCPLTFPLSDDLLQHWFENHERRLKNYQANLLKVVNEKNSVTPGTLVLQKLSVFEKLGPKFSSQPLMIIENFGTGSFKVSNLDGTSPSIIHGKYLKFFPNPASITGRNL